MLHASLRITVSTLALATGLAAAQEDGPLDCSRCVGTTILTQFAADVVAPPPELQHRGVEFSLRPDEFDRMPEDLLARLNFLGVERIATVAANWRYLSPADTLDELGEPKKLFDFRDAYQLIVRDDHRLCEAVAELRRLPAVLSAHCEEPFELFQGSFPNGPPNDPVYPDQWHLNNTGQIEAGAPCDPFIDINAPEAWAISNIAGSPIAILDSGISTASPDLAPFVAPSPISRNFTSPDPMIQPDPDDWNIGEHGTKVAAVAAARGNNAVQIAGTANSHPPPPPRHSRVRQFDVQRHEA